MSDTDHLIHKSDEELLADENQTDMLDVDEFMCRQALLMTLNGQRQAQIAAHFHKDVRTIRRWIKKAKEKDLVRVDNLKPWEQLSETLLLFDQQRIELFELKKMAQENGDGALMLRCMRDLAVLQEKRMRILDKVGLFEGYKPYRRALDKALEEGTFGPEDRTKVDEDEDESECNDDDYDEEEYELEDEYDEHDA